MNMFGVNNQSTVNTGFSTGGNNFNLANISKPQSSAMTNVFGINTGTNTTGTGGLTTNKPLGGLGITSGFGTGTNPGFGVQQQTSGIFPSTSTTSTIGPFSNTSTTLTTSNVLSQNKPTSGFPGQPGFMPNNQVPQTQTNLQNVININNQFGPKIFTLLPTNYLKYEKVEGLAEEIIKLIKQIETCFRNNEIKLNYAQTEIDSLFDSYKTLNSEGVKVVKNCKLINSKKSKINFLIQNLKSDVAQHVVLIDKERQNYHILLEQPSMKFQVPSDYFITLIKELEEKIEHQIQQISDSEALVDIHYRKEHGSFKVNSDLVEETIKEIYTCLIGLVTEASKINDYVKSLKQSYVEMMKFTYGWKDFEIENRIKHFLQSTQDQTENTMRDRGIII